MNSRKLKDLSKKFAEQSSIPSEIIQRNFMMDLLLESISKSEYNNDFILKGGFLLGAKYGVALRSTTDIDTTFNISS